MLTSFVSDLCRVLVMCGALVVALAAYDHAMRAAGRFFSRK